MIGTSSTNCDTVYGIANDIVQEWSQCADRWHCFAFRASRQAVLACTVIVKTYNLDRLRCCTVTVVMRMGDQTGCQRLNKVICMLLESDERRSCRACRVALYQDAVHQRNKSDTLPPLTSWKCSAQKHQGMLNSVCTQQIIRGVPSNMKDR